MLRALAKLIRKRHRVVDLSRGQDRQAFIEALGEANIYIFAALVSDGLEAATFTQEELLAELEQATSHMNSSDGFAPFVYEQSGVTRLPFFSTMEHAQTFCGEYSKERNRIFAFQTLTVTGATLASVAAAANELVLNDKTDKILVLSDDDVALLLNRWG